MNGFSALGMFYFAVAAILHLRGIVVGQSVNDGFPVSHSIAKRMDLETCLIRFDVHLNTIIRTEESRSMGAKFLDDADVSSREQCLRLCCETENCDVFVFEEKNQGTCFLFQCGPPTDFHCKFTHHANYTSAVLKIPSVEQPSPPLVSQIHSLAQPPPAPVMLPKLSQHELELVNLKVPKPPSRNDQTTSTLLPPLGVQLGQLPTTTTPKSTTAIQCGHYEFPCHSGECIAVYNACDGIPQCADGSDEGIECRRPAPVKPFKPNPIPQQQQQQLINGGHVNQLPPPKPMMPQMFQTTLQQQQMRVLQQQQQQQQDQLKMNHQIPHNREDPMTAPKSWPRPMNDAQAAYIDSPDSHIFNHKGGLQLTANNIAPPQYQDTIPDTNYIPNIPRNNPYVPLSSNYQPGPPQWTDPRLSPPQRPMWSQPQLPQEQYVQPPPQHQPDSIQPQIQPSQIINPQPSTVQQQQQPQLPPMAPPNATGDQSKQTSNSADSPKKSAKPPQSSEEYDSYDDQYQETKTSGEDHEEEEKTAVVEKPEQLPKKKQHKHHKQHSDQQQQQQQQHEHQGEEHRKKNKSKSAKKDKPVGGHGGEEHGAPAVHEHLKLLRNDLEIEFADHDGQAERPGGAVLSLTLGAIITAALAILIGCRMKVARRRIRRPGKSSYAHDADFLVNGMYL
ncbi:bromodomain-containing protein 4 [Toxorhynchites rutilus septentrionalis]|uniref:bromodomain-containing protein 4 n=1 Tax=Toxorhynchites rutilus septentrionalis TaxID=329112 RepID=UPI002479EADD|nr:bromodomain-containing protein 4 [Toxorhynchites rutilus septentrionalis]